MKTKDIGALFFLAALWGASFLFMRISAPVLGPVLVIELRVLIAGISLYGYSRLIKHNFSFKKRGKEYILVGAINAAIPFTLIATATLTLDASFAAILNSTTPLFAAIVAWVWLKERLTMKKVIGILIGVSGVVILLGWNETIFSFKIILSAMLSILAAVSYGIGGVYVKRTFVGVDPLSLAIGQQLGAAIVLFPIALIKIPSVKVSSIVILSIIGLALMCTALAYLVYFYLINSVGPTKTLTVTFLVPLFAGVWGAIFLKEKITISMLIGLIIILSSIFIMSDIKLKKFGNIEKLES